MLSSTREAKVAKRNAIIALYLGLVEPRDVERRFPGAKRPRTQAAVKAMGPGLRQNDDYREVERAANSHAGLDEARGAYTNTEFNDAMFYRITNVLTRQEAADRCERARPSARPHVRKYCSSPPTTQPTSGRRLRYLARVFQ